jgi:hypothetical protein
VRQSRMRAGHVVVTAANNTLFGAADSKIRSPLESIAGFEKVVELETEKGAEVKWRFKALHALVLLHIDQGHNGKMLERYREMLSYIAKVTSNETLDAINRWAPAGCCIGVVRRWVEGGTVPSHPPIHPCTHPPIHPSTHPPIHPVEREWQWDGREGKGREGDRGKTGVVIETATA